MSKMSTRTGHRKSGLMDRLRRLRSIPSLQPDASAHAPDKPPPYTTQKLTSSKNGEKWVSETKSQAKPGDQSLDLAKLDSKLEQWAKVRSREEERQDMEGNPEKDDQPRAQQPDQTVGTRTEEKDKSLAPQSTDDKAVMETIASKEAGELPDSVLEASQGSRDASTPIHHQQPQEADAATQESTDPGMDAQPSDFDIFLKKAHEEERLRRERGATGRTAKPKREQPLNQFYGNNWADRNVDALPSKPKLTEIRESEDPAANDKDKDELGPVNEPDSASSAAASTATASLSSSTVSSGSHDFADPTSLQYTVTTQTNTSSQPRRVGRHVSFTEPPTTIITSMRERSASYPVGQSGRTQVRFESPRGTRRRRSSRKKGIGRIFAGFGR